MKQIFGNALDALTFAKGSVFLGGMKKRYPLNAASDSSGGESTPAGRAKRGLVPAAERALAEAEVRRGEIDRKSKGQPKELRGRNGPDPARYGDWEVKGIASDF